MKMKNETKSRNRASRCAKPGREVTTDKIARRLARKLNKGVPPRGLKAALVRRENYARALDKVRGVRS